jgi:hypothetical protein
VAAPTRMSSSPAARSSRSTTRWRCRTPRAARFSRCSSCRSPGRSGTSSPPPTPEDALVAECCRWQFGLGDYDGQLDQSWQRTLRQKLLKNRYGCMFEEIVWGDPVLFPPTAAPPARPADRAARTPAAAGRSTSRFEGGQVVDDPADICRTRGRSRARRSATTSRSREPGRWDGVSDHPARLGAVGAEEAADDLGRHRLGPVGGRVPGGPLPEVGRRGGGGEGDRDRPRDAQPRARLRRVRRARPSSTRTIRTAGRSTSRAAPASSPTRSRC